MLFPTKTNNVEGCLWMHNVIGILSVWKVGATRFHIFRGKALPPFQEIVVSIDFERVVLETMVSMASPPCHIQVEILTEVEVLECNTPEVVALHQERTEEVNFMIDFIDVVEQEYWGNTFM